MKCFNTYTTILLIFMLIGSIFNACQSEQHKNRRLLDQIIQSNTAALGGAEIIDSIHTIKVVNKMEESTYHDSIVFVANREGKMRIDIYDLNEQSWVFSESYDGENGHQWSPKSGQEPASEKGTIALSHTPQYPGHIFQLKDMALNGHKLEYLGKEQISDVGYHVVKLTLSDGFVNYYYLDESTSLITKSRSKRALHVDIDSTEQLIEVQFLDYRKVDGIKKPFRIIEKEIIKDSILMDTEILEYIINPTYPNSYFRKLGNFNSN